MATQRPNNTNASLSSKKRIQELENRAIANGETEVLYVLNVGINTLGAFRGLKKAQSWAKNIGCVLINNAPVYPVINQLHCLVRESCGDEIAKPIGRVGECFIGYCMGFNDQLWSIPLMGERHPLYRYWDEGFEVGYQKGTTPCPYTEPGQVEAWEDGREEGSRRAGLS